jgi:hypothetical protein
MLAAKAIQDTPLYNGQEASTRCFFNFCVRCFNGLGRYLDFAKQPLVGERDRIQHDLMQFYSTVINEMRDVLHTRHPRLEGQSQSTHNKAIDARAFDIARGFLPAGMTTFVSWHTNLRQAHDHLKRLRHHPLKEVSEIAHDVLEALKSRYSASFLHKTYADEEEYVCQKQTRTFLIFDRYLKACSHLTYSDHVRTYSDLVDSADDFKFQSNLRFGKGLPQTVTDLLNNRPPKAELPARFRELGDITFQFPLDFGSYRDLQRHRSAAQPMPLLSTRHGFESWYLDQLPDKLREKALDVLHENSEAIRETGLSVHEKQYAKRLHFSCLTCLGIWCRWDIVLPLS